MRKRLDTKTIVLTAVLAAMTTVATVVIRIPTPSTDGYFNIGDTIILVSGALLSPVPALLVGAIGSALGDLVGGFAQWMLPTAIIKGAEGLLAGILLSLIGKRVRGKGKAACFGTLAMVLCSLVMVVGYFFAGWIMGGRGYAVASVIPNLVQAAVCVTAAAVLLYVVRLPRLLKLERDSREPIDASSAGNKSQNESIRSGENLDLPIVEEMETQKEDTDKQQTECEECDTAQVEKAFDRADEDETGES